MLSWLAIVFFLAIGIVIGASVSWLVLNRLILESSGALSQIYIGAIAGFGATIAVLVAVAISRLVRDRSAAGSLFNGIANSSEGCQIYIIRMKDAQKSGKYITPIPDYSPSGDSTKYEGRQLTPWVTSTAEAEAMSLIYNVLGRIGRTEKIELMYADKDYNLWDAPMFLVGGNWKTKSAMNTFDPYVCTESEGFKLIPTGELFSPTTKDEDLGLLQKINNQMHDQPVWIIQGWRGNGTVGAAYALVRWWRYLAKLYGKKPFSLLITMDDKAGWQQLKIRMIYPTPKWYCRILHPIAWREIEMNRESRQATSTPPDSMITNDRTPPASVEASPIPTKTSVTAQPPKSTLRPHRDSTAEKEES